MASDHFIQFQNSVRSMKDDLGIDITNPRGVGINGSVYPSNYKYVDIREVPPNDQKRWRLRFTASFRIPLENGLMARATVNTIDRHVQAMSLDLHVPQSIHDTRGNVMHSYALKDHPLNGITIAKFAPDSTNTSYTNPNRLKEQLAEFSEVPYQGLTIHTDGDNSDTLPMDRQALDQHFSQYKPHPTAHHKYITVAHRNLSGETRYVNHVYNIETEQFNKLGDYESDDD